MIHYIVAAYVGERKNEKINSLLQRDPTYFVKKHLESLKTLSAPEIDHITFVISPSNHERDKSVVNFIETQNIISSIKVDSVIKEENCYFSYGSWDYAVEKNLNESKYFFLIEDDYFPASDNFYDPFVQKIKSDECAYVSQMWTDKFSNRFPNRRISAISNGLLDGKYAKIHYREYGEIFFLNKARIKLNKNFSDGHTSQIYFLDGYIEMGINVSGIEDNYLHPFLTPDNRILLYGSGEKVLLECEFYEELPHEIGVFPERKRKNFL